MHTSSDRTIDIEWVQSLQALLHDLRLSGEILGPQIGMLAVDPYGACKDVQVNSDATIDLQPGFQAVGEYFRLEAGSARGIFESDILALILSFSRGAASPDDGDLDGSLFLCGRCSRSSCAKAHGHCVQFYLDGKLLNGGVCNNCIRASALQLCSFRRKFSNGSQTAQFLAWNCC